MEKGQGLSESVQELNLQHWGCSEESEDSTTCEVAPSLTSTGSATLEEGSQAAELGDREKRTLLGCHSAESQNRTSLLHDLLCKEKDNFFFSSRKAHVLVLEDRAGPCARSQPCRAGPLLPPSVGPALGMLASPRCHWTAICTNRKGMQETEASLLNALSDHEHRNIK